MNDCVKCGRENDPSAIDCKWCGTSFLGEETSNESKNPKKSKTVAVMLALLFGPLGMIYLGGEGLMIILFLVGAMFFALPLLYAISAMHGGIWISIFGRVACAIWAYYAVENRNSDPTKPSAKTLLNEAAELENVDISGAIAKYREIIELFPDTRASAEAERNIKTLSRANGG